MNYYLVMGIAGLAAGVLLLCYHMREEKYAPRTQGKLALIFVSSVFVGVCAANIANWFFGGITHLPLAERISSAGITWYPGMLASVAFSAIAVKLAGLDVTKAFHMAAPCYPLFHAFGRLGCAVSGCCYGMPIDARIAGVHIDRVPTQLIEAVFLFGLFLLLEFAIKKRRMAVYLLAYAAGRFIIEFFRGDNRGQVFEGSPLSPAQWIAVWSAAVVLCALGVWWYRKRHGEARNNMEELT